MVDMQELADNMCPIKEILTGLNVLNEIVPFMSATQRGVFDEEGRKLQIPTTEELHTAMEILERYMLGDRYKARTALFKLLEPYIKQAAEENPDLMDESIGTAMEYGARLAVADGLEIPEDLQEILADTRVMAILTGRDVAETETVTIPPITRRDFFDLPMSKPYLQQREIAARGEVGILPGYEKPGNPINVGQKTVKGETKVFLQISGKEGRPIDIDDFEMSLEWTVANIIYEKGGKAALPIEVTPQQIYRAFRRLPYTARVTEKQAEETERAMDKLKDTLTFIDYMEQLEKHKNIKRVNDFDYAGKAEEPLIFAIKDKKLELKTGRIVTKYTIYRVPVLFDYSHGVGQIARLDNKLMLGPEKPCEKENIEDQETQNNTTAATMRVNVLSRIVRMKQRKKSKKRYTALIRIDEIADDIMKGGAAALTERGRRTLRKNLTLYLDFLVKDNQIKGYTETKSGRQIVGYTIEV